MPKEHIKKFEILKPLVKDKESEKEKDGSLDEQKFNEKILEGSKKLEKSEKPRFISSAKNFEELYSILEKIGTIKGSKKEYTFEEIKDDIEQTRQIWEGLDEEQKEKLNMSHFLSTITNSEDSGNLRDKVQELLGRKPSNEESVGSPTISEFMFCPFCGEKQSIETLFCGFCGEKIPKMENSSDPVDSPDAGELMNSALKNISRINSKEQNIEESQKLTEAEFEEVISKDSEIWEQDIKTFKLDLEALLPPSFNELDEEQKIKVLQDSKRRIVDIVKSDAQIQYSEDLKKRMQENVGGKWKHQGKIMTGIRNLRTSIKSSFTKERDVKNTENETYLKLINSKEGKELIAEDLRILTEKTATQIVYMGYSLKGEEVPRISYVSSFNIENCTKEEAEIIDEFNNYANNFAEMPYEWGQERKGGNKRKYDKAQADYFEARDKLLKVKESRQGPRVALDEMLQLHNAIRSEQLLNTHPQFETTLNNFEKSAEGLEWKKTIKSFFTSTSFSKENLGIAGVGAGLRLGARGAAILSGTTGITFLAAPIIGGAMGYFRGKIRGEKNLEERQKAARHGQEDKSAEANKTVRAESMVSHLENIINELNYGRLTDKKREALQKRLMIRMGVAEAKIKDGLMDFGDAKSALRNQYNLADKLNEALVTYELANKEVAEEVESRAQKIVSFRWEKISTAQKAFISEQARKGAKYGAGLAMTGYIATWFAENLGWSSGPNTSKESVVGGNKISDNSINEVDKSMADSVRKLGIKPLEESSPTPSATQAPVSTRDPFVQPTSTETPSPMSTPTPTETPTPSPTETPTATATPSPSPTATPIDKAPTAPEVPVDNPPTAPKIEKPIDAAIVQKGQGIEHAFIKQIEGNPKLAQELGFKGDINDTKALHKFAGIEAHKIAIKTGYVDNAGGEVRVIKGGEVAYELKMENGKIAVQEKALDGRLIETRNEGDKFGEGMNDYEYQKNKTVETARKTRIIDEKPKIRKVTPIIEKTENAKISKKLGVVDVPDSKSTDKTFVRPGDKLSESQTDIDAVVVTKEQEPEAAMDAPIIDKKTTPKISRVEETVNEKGELETTIEQTEVTSEIKNEGTTTAQPTQTPEEISENIKTQIELTEKYSQLKGTSFTKNIYKLPEEKLLETFKVHAENIKYITNGGSIEDFGQKTGRRFAGEYIGAEPKEEGDLITPYLNKVAKLANEVPDYNSITGDETLQNFLERCILKITKEGKLDEVKNIKFK